jgi:hypothetical protein
VQLSHELQYTDHATKVFHRNRVGSVGGFWPSHASMGTQSVMSPNSTHGKATVIGTERGGLTMGRRPVQRDPRASASGRPTSSCRHRSGRLAGRARRTTPAVDPQTDRSQLWAGISHRSRFRASKPQHGNSIAGRPRTSHCPCLVRESRSQVALEFLSGVPSCRRAPSCRCPSSLASSPACLRRRIR